MGPPEFTGGNLLARAIRQSELLPGFNGAAGIHRRKLYHRPQKLFMKKLLQWGRRNSPAETTAETELSDCSTNASMGPPEFTGGNLAAADAFVGGGAVASMGPPEFTGGNIARLLKVSVSSVLQWGRRNSPAETRGGRTCHRRSGSRFNGAAGIHRRKPGTVSAGRSRRLLASMGPPEFTGGNPDIAAIDCCTIKCFNGAAGIHRRKPTFRSLTPTRISALQWGRRNSPAETRSRRAVTVPVRTRFNGAAGIHRRKLNNNCSGWKYLIMLQWGRRNSPAETLPTAPVPYRALPASMGPPEFTGGNFILFSCGERCSRRFNGAAGIHRRKRRTIQNLYDRCHWPLQWGRRNSPAET